VGHKGTGRTLKQMAFLTAAFPAYPFDLTRARQSTVIDLLCPFHQFICTNVGEGVNQWVRMPCQKGFRGKLSEYL